MQRILVVGDAAVEVAALAPPGWEVVSTRTELPPEVLLACGAHHALEAARRPSPSALVALLPPGDSSHASAVLGADPLAVVLMVEPTAAMLAEALPLARALCGGTPDAVALRDRLRQRDRLAGLQPSQRASDADIHTARLVALGGLAGGVAHEVNNPLATILAFTQILLAEPRSPDDLEALQNIEKSALRCKRVLEGMLRFSRESNLQPEPFDLNQVVRDALVLFEVMLKTHPRITLDVAMAERVAPAMLDRHLLEQVLVNLLQNAVQAMTNDQGKITLRTGTEGGFTFVSVADTGCGIPPENLPRLFDRGFTTKAAGVGTGLGLAIARDIVARHQGRLEVQSVLSQGTTFTVSVPILQS